MAESEETPQKPSGPNKNLIIIVAVLAALIIGGGAFFFLSKGKKAEEKKEEEPTAQVEEEGGSSEDKDKKAKEKTFLPLPELIVNLKNAKGKNTILRATFVLYMANEKNREHVSHYIPLITDQFQTFLRELDVVDVQGSSGIERIRQELLSRINQIVAPIKVKEVLVKDFLVQ